MFCPINGKQEETSAGREWQAEEFGCMIGKWLCTAVHQTLTRTIPAQLAVCQIGI